MGQCKEGGGGTVLSHVGRGGGLFCKAVVQRTNRGGRGMEGRGVVLLMKGLATASVRCGSQFIGVSTHVRRVRPCNQST